MIKILTFEEWKIKKFNIDVNSHVASIVLNIAENKIKTVNGFVSRKDQTPEFIKARIAYVAAAESLRAINKFGTNKFKKEIEAERKDKGRAFTMQYIQNVNREVAKRTYALKGL